MRILEISEKTFVHNNSEYSWDNIASYRFWAHPILVQMTISGMLPMIEIFMKDNKYILIKSPLNVIDTQNGGTLEITDGISEFYKMIVKNTGITDGILLTGRESAILSSVFIFEVIGILYMGIRNIGFETENHVMEIFIIIGYVAGIVFDLIRNYKSK
jgi:hypothetical protein